MKASLVDDDCSQRWDSVEFIKQAGQNQIPGLHGVSEELDAVRRLVRRAANAPRHSVLIQGPSGTGKEVIARAIHALGRHAGAPFYDLNCATLAESLIESQLFGHERGAFTGAERRHAGYLEMAADGTLFLDEIAELPTALQPRLLRVLEERRFRRLGGHEPIRFEARVVAATHADLAEQVKQGRFRADLFHRLNVLPIRVPPLSERRVDISVLLARFCSQQPRVLEFSSAALELIRNAPWSGNVRQLRNFVDRLAVFSDHRHIDAETARRFLDKEGVEPSPGATDYLDHLLRDPARKDKSRWLMDSLFERALEQAGGNKSEAARALGVHRKVVERHCARLSPSSGRSRHCPS